MQLPIKAHYAVLAMLALALRHRSGELLAARTIASQQRIPGQFLGQILQQLRLAGLIQSARGPGGGFKLARPPERISLAAIMEAIGLSPSGDQPTSSQEHEPLADVVHSVWQDLGAVQSKFLESLTLAELVRRVPTDPGGMFYI
jgi:Rrf2 family transcriptional regulator, iron-sulfur cluster assembly transcription factor